MTMKKILAFLLIVVISISLFVGCAKETVTEDTNTELLVSAAASMTDVLKEIAEEYKEVDPNTALVFTFGSSGALQSQIEEGAPVDLFISAAQKQMTALEEKDLIIKDSKKTLLENKIVLIVPKDSTLDINSFEELTKDEIKKIALGEPAGVPVGQYSEEIFTNLGILEEVNAKAVYGSDVRTVLTWVESGEVDCGVVYATDAFSTDNVKILSEAPEGSHTEVTYPAAIIKSSKNVEKAQAFLDYLSTDEAAQIFVKHGFSMK